MCNLAIIEELGDFFMQSIKVMGEILENVACAILSAIEMVIQIAELAIPGPGKALSAGMRESPALD